MAGTSRGAVHVVACKPPAALVLTPLQGAAMEQVQPCLEGPCCHVRTIALPSCQAVCQGNDALCACTLSCLLGCCSLQ